jgi:serine carboxypeptidase 1
MWAWTAPAILAAISAGELQMNFKGVALGDGWVTPIASVNAWVPMLRAFSVLDAKDGATITNGPVAATAKAVADGRWAEATNQWNNVENAIETLGDNVNF